jgi:hypothetical protein
MNNAKSQEAYLRALYKEVSNNRSRSYLNLSRLLHTIDFVWDVPNDDNRIGDALEKRKEYMELVGFSEALKTKPASVFEVLVGIVYRMMYVMDGEDRGLSTSKLYIELLENLNISGFTDGMFLRSRNIKKIEADVRTKIRKMMARKYTPSGRGGVFPLKRNPVKHGIDLRKTELWYQMMYYIAENYG